jgi:hypothetical protein
MPDPDRELPTFSAASLRRLTAAQLRVLRAEHERALAGKTLAKATPDLIKMLEADIAAITAEQAEREKHGESIISRYIG